MKKSVKSIISGITALCCMAFPTISADCATVDDCAEVARNYGVSETAIQSAYNAYYADPDSYTSEDFDMVIQALHLYGTDSDKVIKDYFGISDEPVTPPQTTAPSQSEEPTQAETQSSAGNNSENSESPENPDKNISSSDFINMTIDQKVEYVNSLPEADRGAFIENLSTEERNSIIKQLPIDNKTELLSHFAEAGEKMGLNMTVDEISEESVSLSIRNNDGTLVDQSSLGVIVEDTGYDYRLLFGLVSAGILASVAGIYLIFRKILKDEKNHE